MTRPDAAVIIPEIREEPEKVRKPARTSKISHVSGTIQFVLWIVVLIIAFFMQVVPFLLVLTMLNLAVGITSGTALILVPVAVFGMLAVACWVATKRTRNLLPEPLPQPNYVAPYGRGAGKDEPLTTHQRLIPFLQRWRQRHF